MDSLAGLWKEVRIEEYVNGEVLKTWGGATDLYISDSMTTFISYPCGGFNWMLQTNWTNDSLFMFASDMQFTFKYGFDFTNDTLILSNSDPANNIEVRKSYFVKAGYDFEIVRDLITLSYNPVCFDSTKWQLISYTDSAGEQIFIVEDSETDMPRIIEIGIHQDQGYQIYNGNITFNNVDSFVIESVLWWGLYPDQMKGMLHIRRISNSTTDRMYQYVRK